MNRTRVVAATSLQLSTPREFSGPAGIHSPAFLLYLHGIMGDLSCGIAPGNSISVLWKARNISLKVVAANGIKEEEEAECLPATDSSKDEQFYPVRYMPSRTTVLSFTEAEQAQQQVRFSMTQAFMDEGPDEEYVAVAADVVTPTVLSATRDGKRAVPTLLGFGGYLSCIEEAWGLMMRGLELQPTGTAGDSEQTRVNEVLAAISRPPRGLLLHGPRGTGKSTLMRRLVEAADVAVEEISHSIVLSRFDKIMPFDVI